MVGPTSLGPASSGMPCFFQRCLAVSSVSTVGLLLLLTKWVFADYSGVGGKHNPAASMDLLMACLTLPMETDLFREVSVVVAPKIAGRHPRPLPSAAPTIVFGVDKNGVMQLGTLRDLAHGPNGQPGQELAKQWATALGCNSTCSWSISLIDFLGKFANHQEQLTIIQSCVFSKLCKRNSF